MANVGPSFRSVTKAFLGRQSLFKARIRLCLSTLGIWSRMAIVLSLAQHELSLKRIVFPIGHRLFFSRLSWRFKARIQL